MKRITALYERERTVAHVLATYHSPSPQTPQPQQYQPTGNCQRTDVVYNCGRTAINACADKYASLQSHSWLIRRGNNLRFDRPTHSRRLEKPAI